MRTALAIWRRRPPSSDREDTFAVTEGAEHLNRETDQRYFENLSLVFLTAPRIGISRAGGISLKSGDELNCVDRNLTLAGDLGA